jgi:hypothetical protein
VQRALESGIKMTIRQKPGELHLITTGSQDAGVTAQHSTGGYRIAGDVAKPSFRYVLERETDREIPVLISGTPPGNGSDNWQLVLGKLEHTNQPFAYVNDTTPIQKWQLHKMLRAEDA